MNNSDTIAELQNLKATKQNTEIDELIRALQLKATITPTSAGTKEKNTLKVKNDKVRIKYKCNRGKVIKVNHATRRASIELSNGQRTNRLFNNIQVIQDIRINKMADAPVPQVPPATPVPVVSSAGRPGRNPRNPRGNPRGGGRDTTTKVEQRGGIEGIPLFCTPAKNSDKALFDKVHTLTKSHIVQTLYRGTDIMGILTNLEDVMIPEPVELTTAEENNKFKVKLWNLEVEEYMLHKAQLKENKVILHTIVWDQCSKSM